MRAGRLLVAVAVVVLAVIHQDLWLWDNRTIVLGFLPIGLAYHAMFSLLAAGVWATAVMVAWPVELEAWADETQEAS